MLIHFPGTPGRTAADADAFLTARGLILRRVDGYGLPERAAHDGRAGARRTGLVVAALGAFMAGTER